MVAADPITRDDLESKFKELRGEVGSTAESASGYLLPAGVLAALLLVVVVFLLGRRRGRMSRTVVEVRRV